MDSSGTRSNAQPQRMVGESFGSKEISVVQSTTRLQALRDGLYHFRTGGISQYRKWRDRSEEREHGPSGFKYRADLKPTDVLQIDFVVDLRRGQGDNVTVSVSFFDRSKRELSSFSRKLLSILQDSGFPEQRNNEHATLVASVPASAAEIVLTLESEASEFPFDIQHEPEILYRGTALVGEPFGEGYTRGLATELLNSTFTRPESSEFVEFEFFIRASRAPGRQVVQIKFLTEDGQECFPPSGASMHQRIGPYTLAKSKTESNVHKSPLLSIPPDAQYLTITGVPFYNSLVVHDWTPEPIWSQSDMMSLLDEFLLGAMESQLVVIDSTAPAVSDNSRALRPNNLALELAERGIKVIFFPFGKLKDFPIRPHENIFQADRSDFQRIILTLISRRVGSDSVYCCTSFSSVAAVTTMDLVKHFGWRTVYEVRDDMEEFNRVGYSRWYTPMLEKRVVERADSLISVSPALADKLNSLVPDLEKKVHVLPNAVPVQTVNEGHDLRDAASWKDRSYKVGYVGHLTESWFDWELFLDAVDKMPDVQFEIVGHGMPKSVILPNNAAFLGPMSHSELLEHVEDWRVGLIPFQPSPLSRGVDPNKLFEYAAWGLRTVSAPMGSVGSAPSTFVYESADEFQAAIIYALTTEMTVEEMEILQRYSTQNTWSHRADQILDIVGR